MAYVARWRLNQGARLFLTALFSFPENSVVLSLELNRFMVLGLMNINI